MSKTDKYRTQHEELLDMASQISELLKADALAKDAGHARQLISTLVGKLKYHLAMEDKSLYPRLLEHPDAKVREVAKRFIDEMGRIAEAVSGYAGKWPSRVEIEKDPTTFITETKGLFGALAERIEKENNELYALVDSV